MGKGDRQSDSHQLLPVVLKNRAQNNPHGAWAQFPISDETYSSGLQTATNLQVDHAVNKVAWLLYDKLGASSDFETIAYIGPFDLRYFIVVLAAIKVGYKTFLPSPRNSKVAQLHLLQKLNCVKVVTTDPRPPGVTTILEELPMKAVDIPSLRELLDDQIPEKEYPYDKSYDQAKDEPIFVLHTSGSTGIPKPLIYTHHVVTRTVNVAALPAPAGYQSASENIRVGHWFTFLAPFHISGIGFGLVVAAFNDMVPIFPLPGQPLTTDQFLEAVKHIDMDWAFVLPFILEDLSKDSAALELVSSELSHLYFAGGSVPPLAGNIVASKIPIYQTTGSSEMSLLGQVHPLEGGNLQRDWAYVHLHPALNAEYRHHYGDLYEMVIVKSPENEELQPVFLHFPDQQEYETRDLLTPHPSIPGKWRYCGRKDDIIVFLNGEKTNPITFEQEVSRHTEVRSAIVAGYQRFEACLLVELHGAEPRSKEEREALIDRIWPTIQTANSRCPAHARISKSNILIAKSSKPMPRAAKGTVQRAATLALYQEEIDRLYAEKELVESSPSKLANINRKDFNAVSTAVRDLVSDVTQWETSFTDKTDFFSLGMDSLQVLQLGRQLNISPSIVYKNPSLDLLIQAVIAEPDGTLERTQVMESLLQHYETEIDKIAAATNLNSKTGNISNSEDGAIVALTGSTGAVGSYILQNLLESDGVKHVYCLNRATNSENLQKERNIQRQIEMQLPSDRITFLQVDLAKPNFGLNNPDLYLKLQATVTHFIHNAWTVDFNQALQSFRLNLDGVLGLASFAAGASCLMSTLYLSSISAVSNYHLIADNEHESESVPEEIIRNHIAPAAIGYGESKHLAENILDYASKKLHLSNVSVARVGQIAGTSSPEQGLPHGWNRHEWLPSLVISSRYLNAIPESLGTKGIENGDGVLDRIDWVPIDQLASLLVEISLHSDSGGNDPPGARVFHPINPNSVTWDSLIPTVTAALQEEHLSEAEQIRVVKYEEWLDLLQSSTAKINRSNFLRKNPAIKLFEFYQSLAVSTDIKAKPLAIAQTVAKCPSMQRLKAVQPEWLCGWIKDWVLSTDFVHS